MTHQDKDVVEAVVERFGREFNELGMKPPKGKSMPGLERELLKDFLRTALHAEGERVRREIKKQLLRLYDDHYHHGKQEDGSTTFITEKDFDEIVTALSPKE